MASADNPGSLVPPKALCLLIYGLYFLGLFMGVTALVGVVIAHVQLDRTSGLERSHLIFQIRTFWLGLGLLVISGILSLVLIGYGILLFWWIWTIIRCVKGALLLNENRPVANPSSLLFG